MDHCGGGREWLGGRTSERESVLEKWKIVEEGEGEKEWKKQEKENEEK